MRNSVVGKMVFKYMNIEAERARAGLSKGELAKLLSASTRTYYNWIKGATPIPHTVLLRMKELFQTSIDYLLEER